MALGLEDLGTGVGNTPHITAWNFLVCNFLLHQTLVTKQQKVEKGKKVWNWSSYIPHGRAPLNITHCRLQRLNDKVEVRIAWLLRRGLGWIY
jgi:hypothetical protein